MPFTAFDGGAISAESLGRGRTFSSNRGTTASGSENPASLISVNESTLYTTTYLGTTSDLPQNQSISIDPLEDRVLQYLSLGAEKGVIFFEPVGRVNQPLPMGPTLNSTDFHQIHFAANAIGLAGAGSLKGRGSMGISLAYLYGSMGRETHQSGLPTENVSDRGDGVRLNFGLRFPTGPAMWGLVIQNAPGFLWWKHHEKETLPVRIRAGTTYKIRPGILFTAEGERRYYNEGGNDEGFLYFGQESFIGKFIILQAGVWGTHLDTKENRHYTGGLGIKTTTGALLHAGVEKQELLGKKIYKTYLSVKVPLN